MRAGIFATGIVLLIVGLILTIFLWPFVALPVFGYYTGPDETPKDVNKGEVYRCIGTVDDSISKGDYTLLIIDFDNGESWYFVGKGDFSNGERVILKFEINDDMNESTSEDRERLELDEDDKKEVIDGAEGATEDIFKTFYDAQFGDQIELEVQKTPDLFGILGIIVLIIGLILMIVGGVLKSKKHRAGQPPPRDYYDDRRPRDYDQAYDRRGYDRGPPPRDIDRDRRPPPHDYDRDSPPRDRDRDRRPPPSQDRDPYYDDEPRRRDDRRPPPCDHNGNYDRDRGYGDRYYDDGLHRRDNRRPPPPPPPPEAHGRRMDEPPRRERDDDRDRREDESKFCPECGARTRGKRFCPECGERL